MKELDSGCVKESGSLRSQTVSQPPVDVSGGNHRQHKHTRKNKPTKTQANTKHEKEVIKWTRTHWCFMLNNLCLLRQVQCVHANDARPLE